MKHRYRFGPEYSKGNLTFVYAFSGTLMAVTSRHRNDQRRYLIKLLKSLDK